MFHKLFTIVLIAGFVGASYADDQIEPTKEERIEFVSKLEQEFEKKIAEDKSLSEEDIKEMREHVAYLKEKETWPRTLEEAVDSIISTMPKKDAPLIMKTPRNDLVKYHHGWGTGIRNAFGLWKGNPELMQSACGKECHPDDASMKIIEAVWDRLHNQALKKDVDKNSAS